MGIVVIGATFVDIKGYPFSTYLPAGRNAGRVEQVDGGVCRNVAEDIANMELRPTFITLLDNTGSSDDVLRKLQKHKINTDYIKRTENGLGTWLAVFDHTGDVVASISKRPDLSPLVDILKEEGDKIFAEADSIILEFDIDKEIVKKTFELSEKYNKKVYAIISNMNLALERRDLIKRTGCFVCNQQEAGILFSENYDEKTPEEMCSILLQKVALANIPSMVVTMGSQGAVYADLQGDHGIVPAKKVHVIDTTGAGDSFLAGVAAGLTYRKTLRESCEIGTRLAASVICTKENVCPRFLPGEFGL